MEYKRPRVRQVFHLQQAGVECGYLSGTQDYEESRGVMSRLRADPPGLKILFVTPEKIARSDMLMRAFDALHARELLARARMCPPMRSLWNANGMYIHLRNFFFQCMNSLTEVLLRVVHLGAHESGAAFLAQLHPSTHLFMTVLSCVCRTASWSTRRTACPNG